MNREFERLIDDLKDADRVALRQINETPSNVTWLSPVVVARLAVVHGLININNRKAELSERGQRVLDHIGYFARKH